MSRACARKNRMGHREQLHRHVAGVAQQYIDASMPARGQAFISFTLFFLRTSVKPKTIPYTNLTERRAFLTSGLQGQGVKLIKSMEGRAMSTGRLIAIRSKEPRLLGCFLA